MTDVTLTFVSGVDDVKIAESIANHLGKPVVITRHDGTKNYVLPCETAVFNTRNTDGNDPPIQRGPHRDEDEIGFGQPYDSFGG